MASSDSMHLSKNQVVTYKIEVAKHCQHTLLEICISLKFEYSYLDVVHTLAEAFG